MNDCLMTYIEKNVFNNIDNELIIQQFQNMESHRTIMMYVIYLILYIEIL